jgi:outer membrane receptor for ferrienterochelin and colicins
MKNFMLISLWLWIIVGQAAAQQVVFSVQALDEHKAVPLAGVIVQVLGTGTAGITDTEGKLDLSNLPPGSYQIRFQMVGFERKEVRAIWTAEATLNLQVLLHEAHEALETVIVSSTRSSRTVADIPTRVEFISGEELEEKANMKPGDIRLLLSESTGILVQITSATSANASIRIQGLDGRYTQMLRDGFPLYSGSASGLSLLQIPPLDLRQVEVIKGSSSTLYGGGAIAGLVNLISKTPAEEGETSVLLNGTSAGGFDASAFYGKKNELWGSTLFAAYNANAPYDPAGIGLSAIPNFKRYTFNPRLFAYPTSSLQMDLGLNLSHEDRRGGDMELLREGTVLGRNAFFENNLSTRVSSQFSATQKYDSRGVMQFKNALNYFARKLQTRGNGLEGNQFSTFSEFNYQLNSLSSDWVFGGNLWTEQFEEVNSVLPRSYNLSTIGAFVQNTWNINEVWILESGLRTDNVSGYGLAVLPRLALLWKSKSQFTSRIGGGLGYKAPTIFTEESERLQYQNILPLERETTNLERSYGLNWDLNYRTALFDDKLVVHLNHLFFYTYLHKPLFLEFVGNNLFRIVNQQGWADTRGMETNLRWESGNFKWIMGYTYTHARLKSGASLRENPLTPRHRFNSVLFYEVHDKLKIGWESYSFSRQQLSDGSEGQSYWIMGFMAERIWEGFSLFINFENFLDARQTRFDSIFTGDLQNPQFREIYAPLDGFVFNGGLKIRL